VVDGTIARHNPLNFILASELGSNLVHRREPHFLVSDITIAKEQKFVKFGSRVKASRTGDQV
jgi:hypothetical protein